MENTPEAAPVTGTEEAPINSNPAPAPEARS